MKAFQLIPLFSIFLACSGDPDGESDTSHDELVGGSATTAFPSVGELHLNPRQTGNTINFYRCTGTLISPRVIVTAGHCVSDLTPNSTFGTFLVGGAEYTLDRKVEFTQGNKDVDLALVRITAPVKGVAPSPIAARNPSKGEAVTLVGFGCTERAKESGGGTKRSVQIVWGKKSAALCPGDSGGPTFSGTGAIAGINVGFSGRENEALASRKDTIVSLSDWRTLLMNKAVAWEAEK